MASRIYQHVTSTISPELVLGNDVAVNFSATLDECAQAYESGRYEITFEDNLYLRYGETLFGYFRKTLSQRIRAPVYLSSIVDIGGSRSLVQMGQLGVPQHHLDLQPVMASQTATSNISAPTAATVAGSKKKVPRPMNSWMMFRDMKHRELKIQHPDMSVQEISKRCSNIWRSYSDDQKKYWKDKASEAAEVHKHLHPDYKYQPRKAGEKKKRQSRKAKLAATAATTTTAGAVSTTTLSATMTDVTPASQAGGDVTTGSSPLGVDAVDFFSSNEQDLGMGNQLFATESIRQDRLQAEFDADFNMDLPTSLFDEEAFRFRTGADGSATLPPFFSYHF